MTISNSTQNKNKEVKKKLPTVTFKLYKLLTNLCYTSQKYRTIKKRYQLGKSIKQQNERPKNGYIASKK